MEDNTYIEQEIRRLIVQGIQERTIEDVMNNGDWTIAESYPEPSREFIKNILTDKEFDNICDLFNANEEGTKIMGQMLLIGMIKHKLDDNLINQTKELLHIK